MGLLFNPGLSWSKAAQVDGVHYQPEGLVIQVSGGNAKPPQIETWPNLKDGVNTELLIIRMPGYEGNCESMQQAVLQEITSHEEVKQLWVSPIGSEKKNAQGVQIVLEVVTPAAKPEFKPELLSQGDDQWIVTLQSVASQLKERPAQAAAPANGSGSSAASVSDNPAADTVNSESQAGKEGKRKWRRQATSEQAAPQAQDLLAALNQAKQRQAELGAQVVTLQHDLDESNAQKESLQTRLNGYENLLEATGINFNDSQQDDKIVIQNLKNALVKVAQKLKTAEEELAKTKTDLIPASKQDASLGQKSASKLDAPPATKPEETPVRNLVEDKSASVPPVAALSTVDTPALAKAKPEIVNQNPSQNVYKTKPTALTRTPQKEDAATRLQEAIRENPIEVDNYLSLADYYVSKQDWKNAQSTLNGLTRVEPGGAQGYYYLTMIYLFQNDRKSAQAALEHYAQRNPKDVAGLQTLKKAMLAEHQNISSFSKMPKVQTALKVRTGNPH